MNTSRFLRLCFLALPFAALTGAFAAATEPASAKDEPATPMTCPVSDEEIGSMGEAYIYVHQEEGKPDREVALCCKMCVSKFKADPAKYLSKADAAKAPDAAPSESAPTEHNS